MPLSVPDDPRHGVPYELGQHTPSPTDSSRQRLAPDVRDASLRSAWSGFRSDGEAGPQRRRWCTPSRWRKTSSGNRVLRSVPTPRRRQLAAGGSARPRSAVEGVGAREGRVEAPAPGWSRRRLPDCSGMDPPGVDPRLVTDGKALEALCDELVDEPVYGFDTEFHTERTYYPHLALIQLAWRDQVAIVDPLAVDPAPLGRVLAGPGLAVAHASEQDLDVLETACGTVPSALFDTQVAAGFLGMSSPSLARLLDEVLGVRLPKADRRSDWLARPMTGPQLAYASNDVAHLLALRDALVGRLNELGRLEWAIDECTELLTTRRLGRVPEEAWWKMGDIRRMSERQRGVAQEVAAWRERRAAASNRPRSTVRSDLATLAISKKPPARREELTRLRGVDGRHLAQGA